MRVLHILHDSKLLTLFQRPLPWPPGSIYSLSQKGRHFHRSNRSWVKSECYCPHTVNISNINFTNKKLYNMSVLHILLGSELIRVVPWTFIVVPSRYLLGLIVFLMNLLNLHNDDEFLTMAICTYIYYAPHNQFSGMRFTRTPIKTVIISSSRERNNCHDYRITSRTYEEKNVEL